MRTGPGHQGPPLNRLLVLAGLPGVGKSTVARQLAQQLGAAYLRIDSIEQALRAGGMGDIGPAGYVVAYRLAADNLRLGRSVVADAVNPLEITRQAWREVAAQCACPCLVVELVCSDAAEHRRRVEGRSADIAGHRLPSWEAIGAMRFEPLTGARLVIDSAAVAPAQAVATIVAAMQAAPGPSEGAPP